MAKTKDLTEIYLTSDLEGVSGGSAGFTLEAIWFGYLKEYVYTGSSSPDTCWLPSYPLDEGLALKAQLDKIAAKTVASELAESKDFGYTVPLTFDGKTFPNKVCVESSTWFMEVLLDTTKPGKCPPVQSVNTVTVVKDSPETLARIQSLEATISTLTRQLQAASKPMTLQDYFINPRPAEGKVLKVPATDLPAKVSGYP